MDWQEFFEDDFNELQRRDWIYRLPIVSLSNSVQKVKQESAIKAALKAIERALNGIQNKQGYGASAP